MKILELNQTLKSTLSTQLQSFESNFWYPLENKHFRITHGDDYTAFYEAMGPTICLVALVEGVIQGIISCALRNVITPLSQQTSTIAYIGDLKIRKSTSIQHTYFNLATHMISKIHQHTNKAIAVVMHGNKATPECYTGRLNIPLFQPQYTIQFMRIATPALNPLKTAKNTESVDLYTFLKQYCALNKQDYFLPHMLQKRSKINPIYLITKNKGACGILEDTRKSKRLFDQDDHEIISTHLSYFAYSDRIAALQLITEALHISRQKCYPALFVSIPIQQQTLDIEYFSTVLKGQVYHATVYGTAECAHTTLHISTSEI